MGCVVKGGKGSWVMPSLFLVPKTESRAEEGKDSTSGGRKAVIMMLFYVLERTECFLKSRTGIKPGCQ